MASTIYLPNEPLEIKTVIVGSETVLLSGRLTAAFADSQQLAITQPDQLVLTMGNVGIALIATTEPASLVLRRGVGRRQRVLALTIGAAEFILETQEVINGGSATGRLRRPGGARLRFGGSSIAVSTALETPIQSRTVQPASIVFSMQPTTGLHYDGCDWIPVACGTGAWDEIPCPVCPPPAPPTIRRRAATGSFDFLFIGETSTVTHELVEPEPEPVDEWGEWWLDTSSTDYAHKVYDAGELAASGAVHRHCFDSDLVVVYYSSRVTRGLAHPEDKIFTTGTPLVGSNGVLVLNGISYEFDVDNAMSWAMLAEDINTQTATHGVRASAMPHVAKVAGVDTPYVLGGNTRFKLNSIEPIDFTGSDAHIISMLGLPSEPHLEPPWDFGDAGDYCAVFDTDDTGLATGEVQMWQKLLPHDGTGAELLWTAASVTAEWQLVGAGNLYRAYNEELDAYPWNWFRPNPGAVHSAIAQTTTPLVGTTLASRAYSIGGNPGALSVQYWPSNCSLDWAYRVINHNASSINLGGSNYVSSSGFYQANLAAIKQDHGDGNIQVHMVSTGYGPLFAGGAGTLALGFTEISDGDYFGSWFKWYYDTTTFPGGTSNLANPADSFNRSHDGPYFDITDVDPFALKRFYFGDQSWHDWPAMYKRSANFQETPTNDHYVNAYYDLGRFEFSSTTYSQATARFKFQVFDTSLGMLDLQYHVGDEAPYATSDPYVKLIKPAQAEVLLEGQTVGTGVVNTVASIATGEASLVLTEMLSSFETANATQVLTVAPDEAQMLFTPIAPTVIAADISDPYVDNVVLLMHFEGANNSTSFVDESGNGHTFTRVGSPVISTAQFRTGTSSLFNPGTTTAQQNRIYTDTDLTDFVFDGDFTIEGWVYPLSQTDGAMSWISTVGADSVTNSIQFSRGSTGNIGIVYTHVTSNYTYSYTAGGTVPLNTWTHVAVDRAGSTVRMYINGVTQANTLSNSATWGRGHFELGAGNSSGDNQDWNGYIDFVRITKGVARYAGVDFTPPE